MVLLTNAKWQTCFLKYTPCEEYMAPTFHCQSHDGYFWGDCRGGRAVELRWSRERAWKREWQPIPVLLPRKSHGQKNLAGYSPWGHKESDTTLTHSHTHTHTHTEAEGYNKERGEKWKDVSNWYCQYFIPS